VQLATLTAKPSFRAARENHHTKKPASSPTRHPHGKAVSSSSARKPPHKIASLQCNSLPSRLSRQFEQREKTTTRKSQPPIQLDTHQRQSRQFEQREKTTTGKSQPSVQLDTLTAKPSVRAARENHHTKKPASSPTRHPHGKAVSSSSARNRTPDSKVIKNLPTPL